MNRKTYSAKKDEIQRKWYLIDLKDRPLGRVATQVADILRGKNKPQYTPHVDTGDFVVAINAEQVKLTGNKLDQKVYYRHSGYPGGLKETVARKMLETKPEEILKAAVKGMLPKSILGRTLLKKLKVYRGAEHPHAAQQPASL